MISVGSSERVLGILWPSSSLIDCFGTEKALQNIYHEIYREHGQRHNDGQFASIWADYSVISVWTECKCTLNVYTQCTSTEWRCSSVFAPFSHSAVHSVSHFAATSLGIERWTEMPFAVPLYIQYMDILTLNTIDESQSR